MRVLKAAGSLLVLALFPVFVLVVFLGIVVGALAIGTKSSAVGAKLILFVAIPLIWSFVVAIKQVLQARPQPTEGPLLTRAAHPALWAEVDALAGGLRTEGPARIVLVPDVNAAVTQVAGQREMLIGLPLLGGLTVSQLRGVLAHELGHYGAGHTRLTALTWRARAVLTTVAQSVEGLASWLIRPYAAFYGLVSAASTREQELQADRYAAQVAGPAALATALREVSAIDLAWSRFVGEHLRYAALAKLRAPLVHGLRCVAQANRTELDAAVDEMAASGERGPWSSTHPTLAARLTALAGLPASPVPSDDRPATVLLGAGGAELWDLEQALTGDQDPAAEWDEVARVGGAERARLEAGALSRAAAESGLAPALSVGDLLGRVAAGTARGLVGPLVNPGLPPEERPAADRAVLAHTLAATVATALIDASRARFVPDWRDGVRLVRPDGSDLELTRRCEEAVDRPDAAQALVAELAGAGVEPTHQIAPVAEAAPTVLGMILELRVPPPGGGKGPTRVIDLVVCGTGVLVLDLVAGPGQSVPERARAVVAFLDQSPDVRTWAGGRWIDTSDIVSATGARDRGPITLVTRVDTIELQVTGDTTEVADAYAALRSMLGARLTR